LAQWFQRRFLKKFTDGRRTPSDGNSSHRWAKKKLFTLSSNYNSMIQQLSYPLKSLCPTGVVQLAIYIMHIESNEFEVFHHGEQQSLGQDSLVTFHLEFYTTQIISSFFFSLFSCMLPLHQLCVIT
jgi:hypothetical protein